MLCSPVTKKVSETHIRLHNDGHKPCAAAKLRAEDMMLLNARIFGKIAARQHSKIGEKNMDCEKQTKTVVKDCAISHRRVLWKPVDKKLGQC